jgi:predicted RNase H-like HicB family nuclease
MYRPSSFKTVAAQEHRRKTETDVRERIRTAIEIHLRGMREDGDAIPQPTSTAAIVEVAA